MSQHIGSMDQYVSYALAAAHRAVNGSLTSRLKKHGLQIEAWRIIEALEGDPRLTMGELAHIVLINPPTLSKLVDRMVSNGLVHRQVAQSDQRQINLLISDLGKKRMMQIRSEVEDEDQMLVSRIGAARMSQRITLLNDLVDTNRGQDS
ncbi:MAG: MarR family transcriptional regulator [Rhodobacteraceae bacterium]|nr:MarR family transcriptional regulator [Paracoccaceae bacterium]PHR54056.1 MAG: transcriptional regulator [Robiginitomaculum sp.]